MWDGRDRPGERGYLLMFPADEHDLCGAAHYGMGDRRSLALLGRSSVLSPTRSFKPRMVCMSGEPRFWQGLDKRQRTALRCAARDANSQITGAKSARNARKRCQPINYWASSPWLQRAVPRPPNATFCNSCSRPRWPAGWTRVRPALNAVNRLPGPSRGCTFWMSDGSVLVVLGRVQAVSQSWGGGPFGAHRSEAIKASQRAAKANACLVPAGRARGSRGHIASRTAEVSRRRG